MGQYFFEELLAILCASLVITVLLRRLRLPNIVAYLLAGVLVGPHASGLVERPEDFAFLAEFGVVFLLFSLGLEFSLPKLLALRRSVFGLGSVQVAVCALVFGASVLWWGSDPAAAVIIAGALALSSTAIVTKELSDQGQIHSRHGQLSIGVLLFQDLAAVLLLILVPALGGEETSLWHSLGLALGKGLLLTALLLSAGKWVLPRFYREVSHTRSDEIFVLSTLVIVLLAAWVTHSFHLSMALGGFVIGMMLGESQFRHQINSDIRTFKDILLGLFFVTIGMDVQLELLLDYWPRILLFTAGLILVKVLLISFLVKLAGDDSKTALQTGLNLAQAGEFGLALLTLAVMHDLLPRDQSSFIILVAVFSMAASPFLIRYNRRLSTRLLGDTAKTNKPPITTPMENHVIIGGFGRVGRILAKLLDTNDIDYIAIDRDTDLVSQARAQGHNVIYGDSTSREILQSCHIDSAKMAILTFRSLNSAKNTLEHLRASGVTAPIIVRCFEHGDLTELVSLGADYVVPEMLEASLVIGSQMLQLLGVNDGDIEHQIANERAEQLQ